MENPEEVRLDNIIIIYVINFTREIVHVFVMSPESYLMGGGRGGSFHPPLITKSKRKRRKRKNRGRVGEEEGSMHMLMIGYDACEITTQ